MPIIIPANSAAGGGFEVDNSVRLDFASSTRFERTPSSASNRRTWTFSSWLKKAADENSNADFQQVFSCPGSGGQERIMFEANKLTWDFDIPGVDYSVATVAVQRDHSAFYHIVVTKDTTQGTEANRVKMYINGVQQTLAEIQLGFPDQNAEGSINTTAEHQIWAQQDGAEMSGYACETCFVDGTALAADSFGEFDEDSGVWKPIDVSALTLGTNGYFLNYQDSSALGNSSNSNNYTTANLAAIDQTTDTCTNNFATLNPIDNGYGSITFIDGNTKGDGASSGWQPARATVGLSSGKWYWEVNMSGSGQIGVSNTTLDMDNDNSQDLVGVTVFYNAGGGYIRTDGSQVGGTVGTGDMNTVFGYALDMDNKKLSLYKTNSIIVTNTALSTSITDFALPFFCVNGGGQYRVNFGNPSVALDNAGVADGNGYGSFEYAPPTGYLAICTKNLSETDS